MSEVPVLLAVDGNSLVHRSYHALAGTGMRTPAGAPIWAVRGLLSQLVAAADRICPSIIVVGFDDPDASIRRATWPDYKAHRVDKLKTLVSQLALAVGTMAVRAVRLKQRCALLDVRVGRKRIRLWNRRRGGRAAGERRVLRSLRPYRHRHQTDAASDR